MVVTGAGMGKEEAEEIVLELRGVVTKLYGERSGLQQSKMKPERAYAPRGKEYKLL